MKTPNLDQVVKDYISFVVNAAEDELDKTRTIRGRKVRRVASGRLKRSLYGQVLKTKGDTSIGFGSTTSYGKQIEYGVNGTRVNWKSPFSYRGENVNTNWVVGWVRSKRIQIDQGSTVNGLRYVIGRSLARNGIAPVPYFQLGVEAGNKKFNDKMFDAYFKDLDKELDKKFQ